jgi:UDP-N-acetylglucosamine diphosphorylase/glucosamine-1-phosphate N-acetyltransferase
VILGHGRDQVSDTIDNKKIKIAVQEPPQGTGHAVMQAEEALKGLNGEVVILSGDVPLLTSKSLQALVEFHREQQAALTVASARAPEPFGYGRIVRDDHGEFLKIVEEKDATDEIRKIDEINTGIYCVDCESLFSALHRTTNDNAKGEYYLTDIVAILRGDGKRVTAANLFDFAEVQGINTQEELRAAEAAYLARAEVEN